MTGEIWKIVGSIAYGRVIDFDLVKEQLVAPLLKLKLPVAVNEYVPASIFSRFGSDSVQRTFLQNML